MRDLPLIKASYDWFLAHYQREVGVVAANGDLVALERLDEKRDIFERGIFILMFAQFELSVNGKFDSERTFRVSNPDWRFRRGWDADSLSGKKVPFETKLAMVLDKRSQYFNEIRRTYDIRNHCAHGGTNEPVGSIEGLANALYEWHRAIQ